MRTRVLAQALAVAAIAGTASADKIFSTSIEALSSADFAGPRSTWLSTGFEASEGFSVGGLPQNGWTEFAATPNGVGISAAHPASGSQHLRIVRDLAAAAGSLSGGFSPEAGAQSPGYYAVSVDFATNDAAGADYDIIPQAPTQGFLTARMKFSWTGDILVLDDTGTGLNFIDTGVDFVADGAYRNVSIIIDSINNSIDYYYNGSLIYSSVAGVFAGTAVEQVVLVSDNFQNADGWGDFDNLSITVPAPGAIALMGLGGLVASRRRRA